MFKCVSQDKVMLFGKKYMLVKLSKKQNKITFKPNYIFVYLVERICVTSFIWVNILYVRYTTQDGSYAKWRKSIRGISRIFLHLVYSGDSQPAGSWIAFSLLSPSHSGSQCLVQISEKWLTLAIQLSCTMNWHYKTKYYLTGKKWGWTYVCYVLYE